MLKSILYGEYQDSALDAGEYTIQLSQSLTTTATVRNQLGEGKFSEGLVRTIIVQGKRFGLDPSDIASAFPAPGSNGDFTAVLPHLILQAKTLPWQRSPDGEPRKGRENGQPNYPWLALLVFNESDGIPVPKKINLKTLWDQRSGIAPWIKGNTLDEFLEYGEKADDPVTVIDINRSELTALLPSPADLALLAHVRGEGEKENPDNDSFQAVLVANRLPVSKQRHTAHLVSLMNCFEEIIGLDDKDVVLRGSGNGDFRLVSLYSWTFYCEDDLDFKGLLLGLNKEQFRLPEAPSLSSDIKRYFQDGFTVLPHHLRVGRDVASLYRGPLVPGVPGPPAFNLPVESADHLLLYDRKSGMLDVSYAAAWTLGRQLALEDTLFSLNLYQYKRRLSIAAERSKAQEAVRSLPLQLAPASEEQAALKTKILDWLKPFADLQGIPFHYLVPQEALLPQESIRFFNISHEWIQCLQYGALSLGGDLSTEADIKPADLPKKRYGFLLRSKVVTEFPKLRVEGYADIQIQNNVASEKKPNDPNALTPSLRVLAPDLLLALFDAPIQSVDIFLDPKNLYFGFKEMDDKSLEKDLKDTSGGEAGALALPDNVWRSKEQRVLKMHAWAKAMQTKLKALMPAEREFDLFTSADFALQMVEGAPLVRFVVRQ